MKQILMEPELMENIKDDEEKAERNIKSKVSKEEKKTTKEKSLIDLPGVGPATAENLEAVGYNDLMSVAVATPGELIDVTGMSEAAAKKIIAAARASLEMGFESGEDVLKKREQVIKLSTGSKAFDALVGGGLITCSLFFNTS